MSRRVGTARVIVLTCVAVVSACGSSGTPPSEVVPPPPPPPVVIAVVSTNRYWVGGGSSANWDATGPTNWGTASNTRDDASVPGPDNDVFFDGVGTGASNVTISGLTNSAKSLRMTGYANEFHMNSPSILAVQGSVILSPVMTYSCGEITGTCVLRPGGNLTTGGLLLNDVTVLAGGAVVLQDAFRTIGNIAMAAGADSTFDTNGFNVTASRCLFAAGGGGVRNVYLRSGTITCAYTGGASAEVWQAPTGTFDAGTSTVVIGNTNSALTKTFAGGGKTYNQLTITGDNVVVTGDNTFNRLSINTAGAATGVRLTSGTRQTVASFATNGSAGRLAKLLSTTGGSLATLTSSVVICADYLSIRDIVVTGATWYAGANSVNVSGNTGWIFGVCR